MINNNNDEKSFNMMNGSNKNNVNVMNGNTKNMKNINVNLNMNG